MTILADPEQVLDQFTDAQIEASICRSDFKEFVRTFWHVLPGAGDLIWNWHLTEISDELQAIATRVFNNEPKTHDLLVNISPGTSKTSLFSILFPVWTWTRMPTARIISASGTADLVLDLSAKSRYVVESDKFKELFPELEIREDTNAKGHYRNTHGGERKICTVSGKSPIGFHAHFCFPWETKIETENGPASIGDIVERKVNVKVWSFNHETGQKELKRIKAHASSKHSNKNPLVLINHKYGEEVRLLRATADHPLWSYSLKQYMPAAYFKQGDRLQSFVSGKRKYSSVLHEQWSHAPADGCVYNIEVEDNHNYYASGVLVRNCLIDDPLDPKKALSEAELKTARQFIAQDIQSRMVNKEVSVVCLIMQRMGVGDPSEVMLEESKKEGALPVRHVCLPAELKLEEDGSYSNEGVHPPELADNYIDGLMDPVRLNRRVLGFFKARGALYYSTQFMQHAYSATGGMFEEKFFSNRVKAAPYNCKRVIYVDRAASVAESSCATAITCMAKDTEGNYYVEENQTGHWAPYDRNQRIRSMALRYRSRYGPKYEPAIWVEREGGASGRDAWLGIAKALVGFVIKEHDVARLGGKVQRAEPWSCQLAAGNVYIVDNGESLPGSSAKAEWDIERFVKQHVSFPASPLRDIVDSASGGFNVLMGGRPSTPMLRSIPLGKTKGNELRILVCEEDYLSNLLLEVPSFLVAFVNPTDPIPELPPHGLDKLSGSLVLPLADVDPAKHQDRWDDIIPEYNKTCGEVQMTPEHARKLWGLLLRKREQNAPVWVFCECGGGGRALSTALAVCDCLNLPRESTIYMPADLDNSYDDASEAPNSHVFAQVKNGRGLVM